MPGPVASRACNQTRLTMYVLSICQVWAILTICVSLNSVNAKMESEGNRKQNSFDSVLQNKLRLLSARPEDGARVLKAANASDTIAKLVISSRTKLRSGIWNLAKLTASRSRHHKNTTHRWHSLNTAENVTEIRQLPSFPKRIYKRSPVMDKFRIAYSSFYRLLHTFVELLSERLKPEVPPTFQNIKLITQVMPLTDFDIARRNVGKIIQKFFVVHEVMLAVLHKIQPFIMDEFLGWLRNQSAILKWRMNTVGFVTFSLRVSDLSSDISIASSGIGGSNDGISLGLDYDTLMKLYEMLKDLQ